MALEPAFQSRAAWPPPGGLSLEPDDPRLGFAADMAGGFARDEREAIVFANDNAELSPGRSEPLAVRTSTLRQRKWTVALVVSLCIHAAGALFFITSNNEDVLIAGSEEAGIAFQGNAPEDQISAGDVLADDVTQVTIVETIDAKMVEATTAKPVTAEPVRETAERVVAEAPNAERLEPVRETAVETAKAEPAAPVIPEQAEPFAESATPALPADTVPELLATDRVEPVTDDNTVIKPAEAVVAEPVEEAPAVTVEKAEPVKPEPNEAIVKPVAEDSPKKPEKEVVTQKPEPKPEAKAKEPAKPKAVAEKSKKKIAEAKPAKKDSKAGSGGKNAADAVKGEANGKADGATAKASKGTGKTSAAGNAAVSNYPGKVVAKLRRALKYPAEAKKKKITGKVQVAFTVSASGGLSGARVTGSSGSPILDKAALEAVRRAAPFPAIPAEAGKKSWAFTVPLAFNR